MMLVRHDTGVCYSGNEAVKSWILLKKIAANEIGFYYRDERISWGVNGIFEGPPDVFSSGWNARSNPRDLIKYASSHYKGLHSF